MKLSSTLTPPENVSRCVRIAVLISWLLFLIGRKTIIVKFHTVVYNKTD